MTDIPSTEALLAETAWLRRLALALAGDAHLAEDVVQETLLAALRQPRAVERPRAWLAAVARNLVHRHRRRAAQRGAVERAAGRDEALPPADDLVDRALVHRAAVDAVLSLAEPYRGTLLLRYLDGLSLQDVARRAGVPVETVRTRQKRGLALVRERLDRQHDGRRAWALPLLGGMATSSRAVATGAVLMGAKTKLIAAVAIAAAAAVVWKAGESEATSPPAAPPPVVAEAPEALQTPAVAAGSGSAAERQQLTGQVTAEPSAAVTAVATGVVVDEETGVPIAGAAVSWLPVRVLPPPAPDERVLTDAAGRFELTASIEGAGERVELLVQAPDRALVRQELGEPTPDAVPPRFDVGEISVPPGTGVHGRVLDPAGRAVGDAALVWAPSRIWASVDGYAHPFVPLYETLEVGRSRADGTYSLDCRLIGRGPFLPLLFAVSDRGMGWRELELDRAHTERREQEIRLWPAAAVEVRVADADGRPVGDATVVAEPRFDPLGVDNGYDLALGPDGAMRGFFLRRTGAGGSVRFPALPVPVEGAEYGFRVTAPGRSAERRDDVHPAAGETTVVVVRLGTAATYAVRGTVREPGGQPVAGAEVTACYGETQTTTTDRAGGFALAGFTGQPRPLWVRARAPGFTEVTLQKKVEGAERELTADLVLEPALPLFGVVLDQHQVPVRGAQVHIYASEVHATTDASGAFRFDAVAAGRDHALQVEPPEGQPGWEGAITHLADPTASPCTLILPRVAEGAARLRVELVDPDGRPLEPASVRLLRFGDDPNPDSHPTTGVIGEVTADGLRVGSWLLQVEPTRGHALEAWFDVAPGTTEVRRRLVQRVPAAVRGTVVWDLPEDRRPKELVIAFAHGQQRARWAEVPGQPYAAQTAWMVKLDVARGTRFAVTDVDPTRPLVVEVDQSGVEGRAAVSVSAGLAAELELHVSAPAHLALRSERPWPYDEFILVLRRPGERWVEPLNFGGAAGRTQLFSWPMAPGDVEWRVVLPTRGSTNAGGPRSLEGTVTLRAGETEVLMLDPNAAR